MSTNAVFLRTLAILLIAFDSFGDPSAGPYGQLTTGSITNKLSPGGLIRRDGDQAPNQIQGVTNIIDDIKKALRFIPGDTSKAVETYLSIVRPKEIQDDGAMAGANEGIISYFSDVYSATTPESLCLNMKARLFYASLHEKSKLEGIPKEGPLGRRPSLATRIEQTSDSAGWVWEKAMQLSANDPNEAMSLIGLCGHDDVGAERAILSKPIRENKIDQFSPRILGILQKHRYFECPKQDSRFYYPGSLGKDADISTQLKNKIGLVQAPTLGQSAIPAKYYHVYGGAFMSCQLIQSGISAENAFQYPAQFASVYRRTRLCSNAFQLKERAERLISAFEGALAAELQNNREPISVAQYLLKDKNLCFSVISASKFSNPENLGMDDLCSLRNLVVLEKSINRILAGKMYFEQQQCPTTSSGKFTDVARAFSATAKKAFDFNREFNCQNIPTSNCEGAKKVLETWKVDFEWTMEQQTAGAKFAAKQCKPKENSANTKTECVIPEKFLSENFPDNPGKSQRVNSKEPVGALK